MKISNGKVIVDMRKVKNPKKARLSEGSKIEMPSGAKYEVQKDGSWKKEVIS